MFSKYYINKTNTEEFKTHLTDLLKSLEGKKVLIYGAGIAYADLKLKYDFSKLNIVAIADKKFEEETVLDRIKAIPPEQIFYQDYDVILITNECGSVISNYLSKTMKIQDKEIFTVFKEDIPDESQSYNYLDKFNFKEHLNKLNSKLKGKSVVIYGAGVFFDAIHKYYDLSKLNIIGIADKRFTGHEESQSYLGYKVYEPCELKELKPDYVLVATKFYIGIIEDLHYNLLKNTKIKIKPLVKKDFVTLLKEALK